MHLYPIDGAAAGSPRTRRRSPTATAAGPGSSSASTPTRPTPRRSREWTRDYCDDAAPDSAGGAYVNFMMDEGQDRVRASYRGNYDRLGAGQAALRPGQHRSTSTRTSRRPADPPSPGGIARRGRPDPAWSARADRGTTEACVMQQRDQEQSEDYGYDLVHEISAGDPRPTEGRGAPRPRRPGPRAGGARRGLRLRRGPRPLTDHPVPCTRCTTSSGTVRFPAGRRSGKSKTPRMSCSG